MIRTDQGARRHHEPAAWHPETGDRAELVEYRRTRDPWLRDRIVENNTRLAYFAARKFEGRGEEREDLCQVALLALLHATERFDPDAGAHFATFAIATIEGALKRHLRDHTWLIRPTRSVNERGLQAAAITETLTANLKRTPSTDEVAGVGGWSRRQVEEATTAFHTCRLCDRSPLDVPAVAQVAHTDDVDAIESRIVLGRLLEELDARERRVVELRYFGDRTQTEIADEIGVTPVHIGRLLKKSLDKLHRAAQHPVIERHDEHDAPSRHAHG